MVEKVGRIERGAGGFVKHRHPAEIPALGGLVDSGEEPLHRPEPRLGPRRGGDRACQGTAQPASQPGRQSVHPIGEGDGAVAVVAAEEFVAGIAGQGHRDVPARLAGDHPGRQARTIGERLVELLGQSGQGGPGVGFDPERLVLGPQGSRDEFGVPRLVELGVAKADREGPDGLSRRSLHQGDDDRRVDPAREERPERDVGHHLLADGVVEGRPQLVGRVGDRALDLAVEVGVPVAVEGEPPLVPDRVVRRGELVDASENRGRGRDVAEGQIFVEGDRIDLAGEIGFRQREQRLEFAGEGDPPRGGIEAVDQRFLPQAVATDHQATARGIPDRQREHPPEEVEEAGAFVLVEVDQNLGIARGPESMPPGFEAVAKLGEVVDLAVEDGQDGAVLVGQGLVATGQVDDRQAAKPERDVGVAVRARVVRPAMLEPVGHRPKRVVPQPRIIIEPRRATDSAHARPTFATARLASLREDPSLARSPATGHRLDRDISSERSGKCLQWNDREPDRSVACRCWSGSDGWVVARGHGQAYARIARI